MKKEATILIAVVAVLALVFAAVRAANRTPAAAPAAPLPAAQVQAPPPAQEPTEASVRRIEAQELQTLLSRGEVTVIDVRDADSYIAAHIAGALHIPLARIESEIPYLPRDKPIVTYCT